MKDKLIKSIKTIVAVAIMVSVGAVRAQNVTVEGRVTDAATGEALPFVNVGLMRPVDTVFMRGATTDMDGRFSIHADTGLYLLQVSFVGYETHQEAVRLTADVDEKHIALKGGTMLQAVEVVAEKPLYAMDGEKNMYNTQEDPSIQTGTASDALQNAPGVEVDAEGNRSKQCGDMD